VANVGYATLTVIPSARGFGNALSREIDGPVSAAGRSAGTNAARGISTPMLGAARGIGLAFTGAFAALGAGQFFTGAISGASDLAETVSKANTIFGEAAPGIERWAEGAATALGQSKQQALDSAATFGNLFSQLGIGADVTAEMSTEMVGLASDFASFHNADITEVLNAQQAAFRGEFDAVQRFVPTINAAAVAQRALEMTGKATTAELTEQEKALATQALLMEGAGAAAGDFARTSDGLANRQRILGARFENLKTKIGQVLMPVMSALTDLALNHLLPGLERVGGVVKEFWYTLTTGFTQDEGTPVERFALKVRELWETIQPFIEWLQANWKPVIAGIGIALAAIFAPITGTGVLLVGLYLKFEGFRNVVDSVVQWLVNTAAPAIAGFAQAIGDKFAELVGWVQEHWAGIQEAIGHVVAAITFLVETWIAYIQTIWQAWGDEILRIASTIWDQIKLAVETAINLVRGIIETVVALINGDWGQAWDAFKGVIDAAWTYIRETIENVLGIIAQLIEGALSSIRVIWEAGWNIMGGVFSGAWATVTSAIGAGVDAVADLITGILGRIMDAVSEAASWVIRQADRMLGPLDEILGTIGRVGGAIGGAIGRIPGFATGVTNFGGGLAIVGEGGPELVHLPRGVDVYTNDETMDFLGGGGGSGSITLEDLGELLASYGTIIGERAATAYARKLQQEMRAA
jgi:phage-related protein